MEAIETSVRNRQVIEVMQGDFRWIKLELENGEMSYIWTETHTPGEAFVELGKQLKEMGY